jgi:alkanesulfonate monooxygenase SsuD/methylene tetrahydromethanopterin reductase-like flavin-dependent oxidoreductase (luciferase family)
VEFGVYIPQVGLSFEDLRARAVRCEELGYDSFWLFDHLYAPGLPDQPALEGWTAATALLALTTRLRVGHLVINNNFRHPALVARMASTLDVISHGRFDLGIGSGSYRAEHSEGGFPWGSMAERSGRLEESLEIITRMFSGDRASFTGEHYRVVDLPNLSSAGPPSRPPIHIGGAGSRFTLPLVARYADVWNVPTYALGDWDAKVATLVSLCQDAGRDPGSIRRSLEAVLVIASSESLAAAQASAERRYGGPGWGLHEGGFVGTPSMIVDRIGDAAAMGVSLLVFFPADRGGGDMLELFASEVMPHVR